MIDRLAEFFIFGFAPLVAGMLAAPDAPSAGDRDMKSGSGCRKPEALTANAAPQRAEIARAEAPTVAAVERQVERFPAGAPLRPGNRG